MKKYPNNPTSRPTSPFFLEGQLLISVVEILSLSVHCLLRRTLLQVTHYSSPDRIYLRDSQDNRFFSLQFFNKNEIQYVSASRFFSLCAVSPSVVSNDERRFCLRAIDSRQHVQQRSWVREIPKYIRPEYRVPSSDIMLYCDVAWNTRSPFDLVEGISNSSKHIQNIVQPILLPQKRICSSSKIMGDRMFPNIS